MKRTRLAIAAILAFALTSPVLSHAQLGSLDITFNPGTGADSRIRAVAVQPGGAILIGGEFTNVNGTNRSRVARFNSSGALDSGFDPNVAGASVYAVASQADKVLIGGDFSSVNGLSRNAIARLRSDGSLDLGFDPGSGAGPWFFTPTVRCIALQTNGQVLIGGGFVTFNGVNRNGLARLEPKGSLDMSFDPGAGVNGDVLSVAIQSDGKVLIGGNFTSYDGTSRPVIARLQTDGKLDDSFNPGTIVGNTIVYSLVIQPNGKIVIGGSFVSINGYTRNNIARLNEDGTLDLDFNPAPGVSGGSAAVYCVAR